jgi:hypothetical protein
MPSPLTQGRGLKRGFAYLKSIGLTSVALHAALFPASFFCGELWQFLQAALTLQPSGLIVWLSNFTGFLYSSVSFSREIEQQAGFLNEP